MWNPKTLGLGFKTLVSRHMVVKSSPVITSFSKSRMMTEEDIEARFQCSIIILRC
jgi:hypothetical protein